MSDPVILPEHKKGDTFQGVSFHMEEMISGVPTPINITGAKIRMDLRLTPTSPKVLRLSNYVIEDPLFPGGGLSISNGDNGDWAIDKIVINVPPASYVFDVEFSFPVGEGEEPDIQTLIPNGIWPFTQDVTYD